MPPPPRWPLHNRLAEDEHITIGIIQGEVPLPIGLIGRRIAHIGKATDLLVQRIDLVGIERNAAPDGRAVFPIIRAVSRRQHELTLPRLISAQFTGPSSPFRFVATTSNPLARYQSIERCTSPTTILARFARQNGSWIQAS